MVAKLRTWAFIVGILDIVKSFIKIFSTVLIIICMYSISFLRFLHPHQHNGKPYPDSINEQTTDGPAIRLPLVIYSRVHLLVLVIVGVQCIAGCLLLYGIRKERPIILKFWIILRTISFFMGYTSTLALALMHKNQTKFLQLLPNVFLHLSALYFIYVIYRLSVKIRHEILDAPKRMIEANATCEVYV